MRLNKLLVAAALATVVLGASPAFASGTSLDPSGRTENADSGPRMDDNGHARSSFIDPNGKGMGLDPNGKGYGMDPNGRKSGFLAWLLSLLGWR